MSTNTCNIEVSHVFENGTGNTVYNKVHAQISRNAIFDIKLSLTDKKITNDFFNHRILFMRKHTFVTNFDNCTILGHYNAIYFTFSSQHNT